MYRASNGPKNEISVLIKNHVATESKRGHVDTTEPAWIHGELGQGWCVASVSRRV